MVNAPKKTVRGQGVRRILDQRSADSATSLSTCRSGRRRRARLARCAAVLLFRMRGEPRLCRGRLQIGIETMKRAKATSIDEYLAQFPAAVQARLEEIRATIRARGAAGARAHQLRYSDVLAVRQRRSLRRVRASHRLLPGRVGNQALRERSRVIRERERIRAVSARSPGAARAHRQDCAAPGRRKRREVRPAGREAEETEEEKDGEEGVASLPLSIQKGLDARCF